MTFTTSNTGRCRTCKWWEQWGETERKWEWGSCGIAETDSLKPLHKQTMAAAMDNEGHRAILQTRGDFGCVQWERRHEEESNA